MVPGSSWMLRNTLLELMVITCPRGPFSTWTSSACLSRGSTLKSLALAPFSSSITILPLPRLTCTSDNESGSMDTVMLSSKSRPMDRLFSPASAVATQSSSTATGSSAISHLPRSRRTAVLMCFSVRWHDTTMKRINPYQSVSSVIRDIST